MCWTNVSVHPDHRRQGVGTALLAELTRLVIADGKTRYVAATSDLIEGGPAFAKSLGAVSKQAEHVNHVPIAEADREMLERWVGEGPERAPGYELISWDGPCPDEHAEVFVDLALVMNTAPRDDLEMNDWTWSVKEMREGEERMAAVGCEVWTVVARRIEDGALAGFHDLSWVPSDPTTMWVGSTGVRPEHRGHALGKWLKASLMLRVMDERPAVTSIRTGNADSNDPMLGINKLMGYRPLLAYTTWEVPVADVVTWLETRGYSVQ
jgi:GNAT superfamily N-acetyltransferase